jgi:hypothetical protein
MCVALSSDVDGCCFLVLLPLFSASLSFLVCCSVHMPIGFAGCCLFFSHVPWFSASSLSFLVSLLLQDRSIAWSVTATASSQFLLSLTAWNIGFPIFDQGGFLIILVYFYAVLSLFGRNVGDGAGWPFIACMLFGSRTH